MKAKFARGLRSLLEQIRIVLTAEDEARLIDQLLSPTRPTTVSFFNQHAFNLACADPAFRVELERGDVLLRDGVGLEVALVALGRPAGLNTNGTDLIPKILARTRGADVAIFGTSEPWLGRAAQNLANEGVRITLAMGGFSPPEAYVEAALREQPAVIVLAMGMPRQEMIAGRLAGALSHPCVIINGGAILDFYAHRFPRAPDWMRATRLEWLFRLTQEPGRLASRYLVGGCAFAWRLMHVCAVRLRPSE